MLSALILMAIGPIASLQTLASQTTAVFWQSRGSVFVSTSFAYPPICASVLSLQLEIYLQPEIEKTQIQAGHLELLFIFMRIPIHVMLSDIVSDCIFRYTFTNYP